ncbi:hypothetical protein OCU04_006310 [Sclerotinia nivalis]|uniref:2EXR domain-containing protein n=1 Tax=Sclerotinia nivalis TaxID=352851 RepID=A0A9X0AMZ7_9HELO|nr:hypothetical protein OCU04_006310 [Sclerotinia nivalis]
MFNYLQNWSSKAGSSSLPNSVQGDTTEPAFPLFRKLPREIRFIIWKLAATNPARRVEITDNEFHMNISSPSTLYADFESEIISKEVLSKLFDGQTFTGKTHEVYFCPEKDTIAFRDIRYFSFPQDQLIHGPPDKTYRFPPQPECDSVKILELEEDLGMWMYNAVHFGSLDQLILRIGNYSNDHRDVLHEVTKYYQDKLAHGNCTKIPEIVIQDLQIKSCTSFEMRGI